MFFGSIDVHPYGSFWLDVVDKLLKFAALAVGAAWTLMNYKRGRTYEQRLEPSVSGEIFSRSGSDYLLINCRLRNVGLSKYTIEQRGTGCEILSLSRSGTERLKVLETFKEHGWIEPGEQIDEPLIMPIPDPQTFYALRLNLRIVSNATEWNGSCIVKAP